MSQTDTIDISKFKFSSTVFPTDEDMALWHSLRPAEQHAVIMHDVEKGLAGAPASKASKAEIMAEALHEAKNAIRAIGTGTFQYQRNCPIHDRSLWGNPS